MDAAPALYTIRINGQLGAMMLSAFPAMVPQWCGAHTVLTGLLDRSALYGVLAEIDALGLDLLEVRQLEPDRGSPEPGDGHSPLWPLTSATFAFIEASMLGWASPGVFTMALLGVAGLAAFLAREYRAAAPMLPLSIFRERQFAASGLALLPLTVIMLTLSARSGQLASRIGPRLQLSTGPFIVGAGLAMLTFSTSGSGYVTHVLPAVVVFGLGLGLAITVAPLTATAISSAPAPEECLHCGLDAPPLTTSVSLAIDA